ncbi:hypothetical protein [Nonomuraea salmonea]|uniref:hypothetical protein n=1 Tax=Nonomuraea salmonea TaxID=46181 RepID=UPI002FEDA34A
MPVTSSLISRMLRLGVIVLVGAGQAHTALVAGPPSIILTSTLVLSLALALLPFKVAGRRSADTPIPLIALGAATIIAVALHELTPNGTPPPWSCSPAWWPPPAAVPSRSRWRSP